MALRPDTFIFKRYDFDERHSTARFYYEYEHGPEFVETLKLKHMTNTIHEGALHHLLFNLHIALGISYWKAYCPPQIEIESGQLDKRQALFWELVYTQGLGEFYYTNDIDFRELVKFPFHKNARANPYTIETPGPSLIPLGGGKDSLVSVHLLQQMDQPFETYSLNSYSIINKQVRKIKNKHHCINREISPELLKLNSDGVYDGHVPISMIYAFTALFQAAATGNPYIIVSNERSSNYGNVQHLGTEVNHQWSKSFQFEQLFQTYVRDYITPDITYFSLLRPLYEIRIAEIFSQKTKWHPLTTSCNANFSITKKAKQAWCGHCPKCAFVFSVLAPFIPKENIVKIFNKNLINDETLFPLYQQLFGFGEQKPFECVGTPEEMIVAFALIKKQGEYESDIIMKYFSDDIYPTVEDRMHALKKEVFSVSDEHAIPQQFQTYLSQIDQL